MRTDMTRPITAEAPKDKEFSSWVQAGGVIKIRKNIQFVKNWILKTHE